MLVVRYEGQPRGLFPCEHARQDVVDDGNIKPLRPHMALHLKDSDTFQSIVHLPSRGMRSPSQLRLQLP